MKERRSAKAEEFKQRAKLEMAERNAPPQWTKTEIYAVALLVRHGRLKVELTR